MLKRFFQKCKKYYEFLHTKIKLRFKQKKFFADDVCLKYMFYRCEKSKDLIIVFGSCTRKGIKARYNYVRTLQNVKCNKLFILDDFAADSRGSYYLGPHMPFKEEKAVVSLIKDIIEKNSISGKVLCCGSSKGGYSAFNFGLQLNNSYIIAGAPQFFLGDYLKASGNLDCLEHIIGEETADKLTYINQYLYNRIANCENAGNYSIYLHYSDKEHTYDEHVKYLLDVLNAKQFAVNCDISDYSNHSDISLYFPDFMLKTIHDILDKQD